MSGVGGHHGPCSLCARRSASITEPDDGRSRNRTRGAIARGVRREAPRRAESRGCSQALVRGRSRESQCGIRGHAGRAARCEGCLCVNLTCCAAARSGFPRRVSLILILTRPAVANRFVAAAINTVCGWLAPCARLGNPSHESESRPPLGAVNRNESPPVIQQVTTAHARISPGTLDAAQRTHGRTTPSSVARRTLPSALRVVE